MAIYGAKVTAATIKKGAARSTFMLIFQKVLATMRTSLKTRKIEAGEGTKTGVCPDSIIWTNEDFRNEPNEEISGF
ncbi:MAG: hypothetical protein MUC87_08625 [Bacteroidia bacterium]|jgi:hypothetical protein|nr:hypothetical protein [Bacteroidia bacterium]